MAAVGRPVGGRAAVEAVADRRVGAELEQRPDRGEVAVLRREVQSGDPLAVLRAAERGPLVGIGAECDERPDRRDAAAGGGPGERGAAIDVGVDGGAARDELGERVGAVAARGPGERLVERLLRVVRRAPRREAAVRPVEPAVGAGLLGASSSRPRPAAARRLRGCTPREASSSAVSRLPQNSATISGVPPSPRADTSTRAPASSSICASNGRLL